MSGHGQTIRFPESGAKIFYIIFEKKAIMENHDPLFPAFDLAEKNTPCQVFF